jgi:hypothetical protein
MQRLAVRMAAEVAKADKKQSQAKAVQKRKQQAEKQVPEVLQAVVAVGRGGRVSRRPARFWSDYVTLIIQIASLHH